MAILVKVVRVPGAVVEVGLNDGATVADALAAAGIELSGSDRVSLRAEATSMDAALTDGDRITISKDAKGA